MSKFLRMSHRKLWLFLFIMKFKVIFMEHGARHEFNEIIEAPNEDEIIRAFELRGSDIDYFQIEPIKL